jgi:hypothetical protein
MNRGPAVEALERPRSAPVPRVKQQSAPLKQDDERWREQDRKDNKNHHKHGHPGEGPQGGAADRGQ